MSTLTMPRPPALKAAMQRDATPQEIIAAARSAPAPASGVFLLSGLSAVLMWAAFTPLDYGPLGWVCLIPLVLLARPARSPRWLYRVAWLGGLTFWLPALQWMRLGDPTMYLAWFALAVYLAAYFPLFLALTRVAVHRGRVPLMLAAPVVWVGLELLRGLLLTGFPWYILGHTQHGWIGLIQICDLTGAYGVSFVLALAAGCAAEIAPCAWLERFKLLPPGEVACTPEVSPRGQWVRVTVGLVVIGGVLGYGWERRRGVEFAPGPRVALVQGNFPATAHSDQPDWPLIFMRHRSLTARAVLQRPDWIVWPESMFRWPVLETPGGATDAQLQEAHPEINIQWLRDQHVHKTLADMSQMADAALVIGATTLEADRDRLRVYNSAHLIRPDTGFAGRYDKLHRVIFGEYIPLIDFFPWLQSLTPFRGDFGLNAGRSSVAFEYKGYRCAPVICYEDTLPNLVRQIVNSTAITREGTRRNVDFLVNLTNDGWFHGSSELDQHLITAAFRCVECRLPMVRAVNTGISAFIDGDGAVRNVAADLTTGKSKQVEAVLVETVPLDRRSSLYLAYGDWFAGACLVCCSVLCGGGLASRWLPAPGRVRSAL